LKQGFWGEILVFGWKITNIENCVWIDGKTDGQTDDRYYYIPHRYHGGIIKLDGAWKMCLANGPPMIDYKKLTHYELLLVVFVHAISVLSPYKDHLFTTCPMGEMCIEYNKAWIINDIKTDHRPHCLHVKDFSSNSQKSLSWLSNPSKYFFQIKMYLVHSGRELVQQYINTSQYLKA
jgi:hypothetical protein